MRRLFNVREACLLAGIAVLAVSTWFFARQDPDPLVRADQVAQLGGPKLTIETADWESYRNETYEFYIRHPDNWNIVEYIDPLVPIITLYKNGEAGTLGALDTAQNRTYISFYPKGLPVSEVAGKRRSSVVRPAYPTISANDLVLRDGHVWATELRFETTPESWGPSGFIFARNRLLQESDVCMRGNIEVSQDKCDPLFGDVVEREASIEFADRSVIEAMITSFRFIDPTVPFEESEKKDAFNITSPAQYAHIGNPMRITGHAPASWFFEDSFFVTVKDANGRALGKGKVYAGKESPVSGSLLFSGSIAYERPQTSGGELILEKANPLGLPEHDEQRIHQVAF